MMYHHSANNLIFPSYFECQMVANVIIGFVKDAKHHVPVQGFNVYHRNRLIKVFIITMPFYIMNIVSMLTLVICTLKWKDYI
jgi:hypothetical protein